MRGAWDLCGECGGCHVFRSPCAFAAFRGFVKIGRHRSCGAYSRFGRCHDFAHAPGFSGPAVPPQSPTPPTHSRPAPTFIGTGASEQLSHAARSIPTRPLATVGR